MGRYLVELSVLAVMSGSIEIEASSSEEAEEAVKSKLGDVRWTYEGIQDDTLLILDTIKEE